VFSGCWLWRVSRLIRGCNDGATAMRGLSFKNIGDIFCRHRHVQKFGLGLLSAVSLIVLIPFGEMGWNNLFLANLKKSVGGMKHVDGAILFDRNSDYCWEWASQQICNFVVEELWWTEKPFAEVETMITARKVSVSHVGLFPVEVPVVLRNVSSYSEIDIEFGDIPRSIYSEEQRMKEWQKRNGGTFYVVEATHVGPTKVGLDPRTWD